MNDQTPDPKGQQIEKRIDKDVTGGLAVYGAAGSTTIAPRSMTELMEFSKMVALGGVMIRPAFRNNPGACLALTMQALRWGLDVFSVGSKAYIVKNRAGDEQIAWEAQLVHAVVNTRAPLKGRLRYKYEGDGPNLRLIVTGTLKGETEPSVYESPAVKDIEVKNSPLWKADVRQQLHYYATRAWARRHVPEVIMGVYTPDEIEAQEAHYGPENAVDVTPTGPRPTRAQFEKAEPEEPAETYPLVDEVGETYVKCAYPDQWGTELLHVTGPTISGQFTDKALAILANNRESFDLLGPQMSDANFAKLQTRYAAADECSPSHDTSKAATPLPAAPAGAGPTNNPTPATSAVAPVSVPGADGPAGDQAQLPPVPAPAAAPPTAVHNPSPVQAPAKASEPIPEPANAEIEGPRQIQMPMVLKTNKPDGGRYIVLIQQEMMLASSPDQIDMILKREGYLGRYKAAPGSNLAIVSERIAGALDDFAKKRKGTIGASQG